METSSSPGFRTCDCRNPQAARDICPGTETGSAWYVGLTGRGKTTLALIHAKELANRTCWPILVVDSEDSLGAELPSFAVARRPSTAIMSVWGDGRHTRWIPDHPDEIERIAEACHELGHVVLLVDEGSYYLHSGTRTGSRLLRLVRAHRHAPAWILFTTQHFSGDIPMAAFAGAPEVFVFQTTQPSALKRLREDWGIASDDVSELPVGTCRVLKTDGS